MDRRNLNIVILGGGIAGLAAANALFESGVQHLTVFESEEATFSKASGLNAAIYRPLESDPLLARLAAESAHLLQGLQQTSDVSLLRQTGLLMLGRDEKLLNRMRQNAHRYGTRASLISRDDARRLAPHTCLPKEQSALYSPDGGVLDPHEIGQRLLRRITRHGIAVRTGARVRSFVHGGQGQCKGVELECGERILCDAVVIAAGAESGPLSFLAGAPLPLLPLQRHLAIVEPEQPVPNGAPVVWQLQPEVYFRPEGDGILISPCDETPKADGVPQTQLSALSPLSERLASLCPTIAEAKVRRVWACIRTKSPDTRPVIGPSPLIEGLYYLTGLAGFGMSCGLACGHWLSKSLLRQSTPAEVDPARLYLPFRTGSSSSNIRKAGV